jgi:hypothetical protein
VPKNAEGAPKLRIGAVFGQTIFGPFINSCHNQMIAFWLGDLEIDDEFCSQKGDS